MYHFELNYDVARRRRQELIDKATRPHLVMSTRRRWFRRRRPAARADQPPRLVVVPPPRHDRDPTGDTRVA